MTTSIETVFKEKLWPSPGFFIATLLIIPSMTVLFIPFSRGITGIYVGVAIYLLIIAIFSFTARKTTLTGAVLNTGRAAIETKYLGSAVALDQVTYRQEVGRKLDARAFLAMSGWIKTGVKVEVNDKNDPTPYWIISTRKPEQLAAALNQKL